MFAEHWLRNTTLLRTDYCRKTEMSVCVSGSELAFPACVVNGTGVSKTFQILYRNEEVLLDDVIMFRAHILVDSHKVSTKRPRCVHVLCAVFNFQV
jgi:hypothetical protein